MSNTINNSPNLNNTNILAAKKLDTKSEGKRVPIYVAAPQSLPKYSITEKLNEADEFRKNVLYSNYKAKERKKGIKKFLVLATMAIAGIIGYKYIKKT